MNQLLLLLLQYHLLQQLFYWQFNMLKKENLSKDKTSANQITTATMLIIVMRTL